MKARLVRTAVGFAVLVVLGTGYVVRAQPSKTEIVLEIVVSKGGSETLKTVLRGSEGGTAVIHLADGTEVKLTPRLIPQ